MTQGLERGTRLRPMGNGDLPHVVAIEETIYSHPWSAGNFRDSMNAGYSCWIMEGAGRIIGYGVLMIGVGEAHLLNLSIERGMQGAGLGRQLLAHFLDIARAAELDQVLLEVRPSNDVARRLYVSEGFREIHVRRGYYPAAQGREDAILMALALKRAEAME